MIGIYKITSPSGKVYLGQSWNISDRFSRYRNLRCKFQRKLYNSLMKYGPDLHDFEIVHILPKDTTQSILNSYELLYVDLYSSCGVELLNIREAGSRGKLSEETKQKIGQANSISQLGIRKGYKMPVETKEKIRKKTLGRAFSADTIRKMSMAQIGSKRNLGKKLSEEHKQKLRAAKLGKKHSNETRTKMSIAAKTDWERRKSCL